MVCDQLPSTFDYQDDSIQIDGCSCAVIGIEQGSIVYCYEKLVYHFAHHENMVDPEREPDEGFYDMAQEWVDYNVVRGIAYYGSGIKPTIRYPSYED